MQRSTALKIGDVEWKSNETVEGSLLFVYLVGAEGSNHHGVLSELLVPLSQSQRCEAEDQLGKQMTTCARSDDEFSEFHAFLGEEVCNEIPPPDVNRAEMNIKCRICARDKMVRNALFKHGVNVDEIVSQGSRCGRTILEDNSFPSGSARTPPSPINLSTMFRALSPRIDTRLVVLQRNFYDTVMSHPTLDGGATGHAEKMAEYMGYISGALQDLPSHAWRILPVDCIEANKHGLQKSLAQFLGFPTEECGHCWEHWRAPMGHADEPRNGAVDDVFTSNRHHFEVLDPDHANSILSQYLVDPTTCQ